jgi:2,3-dihydroxybenzoate-AMP ligase/mycobactin salicyl-AMP ligase
MTKYLDGFKPHDPELIKEYTENGAYEDLSYGDLLDRASAQFPDGIAVIDQRTRLTYKALRALVDRFAIALLEVGIRPHDCIILQLPNRHEFVVALYGMFKMGAIPILTVPRHSHRELSTFINLTDAAGWVVPIRDQKLEFESLIKQIRSEFECLKHVIVPENGKPLANTLSMENLIHDINLEDYPDDYLDQYRPDPNDVALLCPTGGTTGLPKIVPRTHNSLIVTNRLIAGDLDETDALLQATPVGHAMAMQGAVNSAMYKGSTLVLESIPRPTEIMETIQREKVTRVFLVPTQLEGVINHPDLKNYDLSSIKALGTTGAALPLEVAQKASDYFVNLGCKFSGSALGASEGLLAQGDPNAPIEQQMKTVGRPVTPGSHYKVIDKNGKERPQGQQGELVVKGPEVFTGYYKTSEEEKRSIFTPDGYYRTGDLAKIDERGFIRITGRIKDVIQRGGETLVPGEMEDLIRKHPSVESASVIGMPDPKMGERACAYVVTRPGKSLSFEEMIDFLKTQGAGVLLFPERLELVEALPMTKVGKIDKKELRRDIEKKLKQEKVI